MKNSFTAKPIKKLIYIYEFDNINDMIGFFIVLGIVLFVLYISMMGVMIILERDKPKNIIIWSIVFLLLQIFGYITYLCVRNVFYKKRLSIRTKQKEDDIYSKLIGNKIDSNSTHIEQDVFEFNNLAFNTKTTCNNSINLFEDKADFINILKEDIEKAKNYILFEMTNINTKTFQDIKNILIEKSKSDIQIKIVHEKNINKKLRRELKQSGIKVYRFSKHNTLGGVYSNIRNAISIDGEVVYVASLNFPLEKKSKQTEVSNAFIRLTGDIVQEIDIQTRKDTIFASGKFIEYNKPSKSEYSNKCYIQYISNQEDSDLELAIIKAICTAKKSIQLQLKEFIPTESIMSLLRFAINSNIQVRLMLPLKNDRHGRYYASRAYAKEIALLGANVYLFDGYITFNAITIDDEYVITGSYIVDREHLNTSLQSIVLIKDVKTVNLYNSIFNKNIDNSYRINNAKFMLLREKFFKNFV